MKISAIVAAFALFLSIASAYAETITFDDLTIGGVPAGFTVGLTGRGGPPKWVVQTALKAEPGNVVA